jgi:hypothetical protein
MLSVCCVGTKYTRLFHVPAWRASAELGYGRRWREVLPSAASTVAIS